jgi:hypothetical protein
MGLGHLYGNTVQGDWPLELGEVKWWVGGAEGWITTESTYKTSIRDPWRSKVREKVERYNEY